MTKLGTAKITQANGTTTVEFMGHGSFLVGRQIFGDCNKGFNAALRFCRERSLSVISCEC